ncbi:MAG: hypothetical protein AB8G22_04245 [Saprospiraceae bacterium]
MQSLNKFLTLICFIQFAFTATAQNPDLPSGEVEVIADFEARLIETEKLDVAPQLPPLDTSTVRQSYNPQPLTLNVEYLPPRIRPIAMRGDELPTAYNGYAKIGAGFPKSFYGDLSYDIFAQEKFDVGIRVNHHSADNTNNLENQRFSNTSAGATGTYYLPQGYSVKGNFNYAVDDYYLYGYTSEDNPTPPIDVVTPTDVLQRFNTVDVNLAFTNALPTKGDLNYHANLDFYFRTDGDLDVGRERGTDLSIGATKWFDGQHPLSVTLRTDFTDFETNEEFDLNNFFLQPNFTYHAENFKVKAGLNLASHNDEYYFFPDAEATANIIGSALAGFVGAKGDLYKNNFRNLTEYNPYIQSRSRIRNTDYINFYGGVKGNVVGFEYTGQVGYKQANNLALFVNDFTGDDNFDNFNRFDVVYDTVDVVTIGGTVTSPNFRGFDLTGTINFNNFSPLEQEEAWHLPAFELTVQAKYVTLEDKVRLKGQLFIENGVPFQNFAGETANLNGLLDISLGAEYIFSENFGAFVDVYNLANNRRERWYNYPTLGINVLAGLTAKF